MDDSFGKDNSQDEIALELAKHEEAMEEAAAEEAFISGEEDIFENPLVPERKEDVESKKEGTEEDEILSGAFGSGELSPVGTPFNNEEAFKDESAPKTEVEETIVEVAPVEEVKEMSNDPVAENPTPAPASEPAKPLFEKAEPAAAPATGEAPKKKKKGLAIVIIVLLLLIAGGLAAFFIIRAHEAPERQISDAIQKLYTADAKQFSGTISIKPKVSSGTDSDSDAAALASMLNIKLTVDGSSKGANAMGSGKLSLGVMGMSVEASVSGAYIANDGIYFKLEGLGNIAEMFGLSDMISGLFNSDDSEMNSYEAMLTEEALKILVSSMLKELDGGWYKIDSSSFEAGSDEAKTYSCVNDAMGKITNEETRKQIAEIYKKHPVVVYDSEKGSESEDGLTFFTVKTDEKASEEFAKEMKDIDAMKSLSACFESSSKKEEEAAPESDTEIKTAVDKTTSEVKLGIAGWSHELKAVKGSSTSDSMEIVFDIKVGYEDKAVSSPEGSKNISGLMDNVKKDVSEQLKTSSVWDELIIEQCGYNYECQTLKKAQLNELLNSEEYDQMIEEMFKNIDLSSSLSGGLSI